MQQNDSLADPGWRSHAAAGTATGSRHAAAMLPWGRARTDHFVDVLRVVQPESIQMRLLIAFSARIPFLSLLAEGHRVSHRVKEAGSFTGSVSPPRPPGRRSPRTPRGLPAASCAAPRTQQDAEPCTRLQAARGSRLRVGYGRTWASSAASLISRPSSWPSRDAAASAACIS